MEIQFQRDENNPNKYQIFENAKIIFYAIFDSKTGSTLLYKPNNELSGKGFPISNRKFQLIPNYTIQLYEGKTTDILVKSQSFFYQSKKFIYEGFQFSIIQHFGTKFSIFKERKQIAIYQTYNFNSAHNGMILYCDDNSPNTLFCLISLYLYSDFGNDGVLTNQPYNFWFQAKKVNKNWRPNA